MMFSRRAISMCLSGGGTRAMAFHAGALKYIAELKAFEVISKVSTVSGGSLLIGLMLKLNENKWPTSEQYNVVLYDKLKQELCTNSLARKSLSQLRNPINFKYLLTRANLLSLALQKHWRINETLSDLPDVPEWSINGTTAENGKRFRFKKNNIGDYSLGYAQASSFLLADALSVSAAFPGGIGPFSLKTQDYIWLKSEWGSGEEHAKQVFLKSERLRIYDGGVYDNLGLEPFFDQSKGKAKDGVDMIFCIDASAPLKFGFSYWDLNPLRFKRLADIISEQARALRVRTFVNYLINNHGAGYFASITDEQCEGLLSNGESVAHYPTSLGKFNEDDFDAIADYGYRVLKDKIEKYGY